MGREELGRNSPDEERRLWRRFSAEVGEEDDIRFSGGCNTKLSEGKCIEGLGTHYDTIRWEEAHQGGRNGDGGRRPPKGRKTMCAQHFVYRGDKEGDHGGEAMLASMLAWAGVYQGGRQGLTGHSGLNGEDGGPARCSWTRRRKEKDGECSEWLGCGLNGAAWYVFWLMRGAGCSMVIGSSDVSCGSFIVRVTRWD